MRITLDRKKFLKALQTGGSFAGSKSSILPICDCVKIKVHNNLMTVESTDTRNAIKTSINIETDVDSAFCVKAKHIYDYVKLLSNDEVVLAISDGSLTIKQKNAHLSLPTLSSDEFPVIEFSDAIAEFEIPSVYLTDYVTEGKDFISYDSLRPIMQGILIYGEDNLLGYCASDSHFLANRTETVDGIPSFRVVLDGEAIKFARAFSDPSKNVKVRISDRHIFISDGDVSFISTLQSGRYPNFKSVIPNLSMCNRIVINCAEFRSSLRRCATVADETTLAVRLHISSRQAKVTINCQQTDYATNAEDEIPATVYGDTDMALGFSFNKLDTILSHINTKEIELYFSSPERACVFKEYECDTDKLYLLMPIII